MRRWGLAWRGGQAYFRKAETSTTTVAGQTLPPQKVDARGWSANSLPSAECHRQTRLQGLPPPRWQYILVLEVNPRTRIVHSRSTYTRRQMMRAGGLAAIPLLAPLRVKTSLEQGPMTANGGSDPYPIPWLDKNGGDNQPAGQIWSLRTFIISREPAKYEDAAKHFRFTGTRATRQLEAQVEVPSIGFSWKSDPLSTSKCDFAVIGEEANGRYCDMAHEFPVRPGCVEIPEVRDRRSRRPAQGSGLPPNRYFPVGDDS